jgi:hypothetical protein
MPWTLHLSPLIDLGGFFSATRTFSGSIFAPPVATGTTATPVDTATSAPATFLTLTFSSSAVPPAGPSAVLVTDTAGGDVLRSGSVAALPSSPASAAVFTPPSAITFTSTALAGMIPVVSLPPTTVPAGISAACALVSGGTFIPLTAGVPPFAVTFGAGSITATAGGTIVARVFYGFVRPITITIAATFAITPSGDPTNMSRVLAVTSTASSITGVPRVVSSLLAPFLASVAASTVEAMLNGLIASMAPGAVTSAGFSMSPTAVISAKGVTITATGISLRFVLADLLGPAATRLPGNLSVSITPRPVENTVKTYTVTVLDTARGLPPSSGATVQLDNFSNGNWITQSIPTDANGQAVFANIRLEHQTVTSWEIGVDGKPHKVTERIPPTLTVTALGFNSVFLDL